jgi:hypothetical protein
MGPAGSPLNAVPQKQAFRAFQLLGKVIHILRGRLRSVDPPHHKRLQERPI